MLRLWKPLIAVLLAGGCVVSPPESQSSGKVTLSYDVTSSETQAFREALHAGDVPSLENYLRKHPEGKHAKQVRDAIAEMLPKTGPWAGASSWLARLDDIDGASVDDATGELIIWGKDTGKLPPLLLDDLLTALEIMGRGEDLGVSIEPREGMKARVTIDMPMWVRYIPDSTRDTHVGSVLYEVDRRLKGLSLGRDNITQELLGSDVPGFVTIPDRVRQSGRTETELGYFGRLWFKPDEPRLVPEGYTVRIVDVKMNLLPESDHPSVHEFAKHMTEHFQEFAESNVPFAELIRLHKLVALARWLREAGFPVEDFIRSCPRLTVKTRETTASVFAVYREEVVYPDLYRWRLLGGVDLSPRNFYRLPEVRVAGKVIRPPTTANRPPLYRSFYGPVPVPAYVKTMNNSRPSPSAASWNVELEGRNYRIVPIPLFFNVRGKGPGR